MRPKVTVQTASLVSVTSWEDCPNPRRHWEPKKRGAAQGHTVVLSKTRLRARPPPRRPLFSAQGSISPGIKWVNLVWWGLLILQSPLGEEIMTSCEEAQVWGSDRQLSSASPTPSGGTTSGGQAGHSQHKGTPGPTLHVHDRLCDHLAHEGRGAAGSSQHQKQKL